MQWSELYSLDNKPTYDNIEEFIGEGTVLWKDLCSYIESTYKIRPQMSYSKCSSQPGWNVKYAKSGKSLCTLYPMEGYFIALVVIGNKEENNVEVSLDSFTPYISELYRKTPFSCGGHWLMINIKDKDTLNDVKRLLNIRVKPKLSA